jgi:ankyrin repeat protein
MRGAAIIGLLISLLLSSARVAVSQRDASRPQSESGVTLTRPAEVDKADVNGTTPLHRAVRSNDLPRVQRLIRAGADVKLANRYGVTPLSLAAVNGNPAIVAALLKAGADANSLAGEGETALMSAARAGHVDVVRQLLVHGAYPDAREKWRGQTALMWAAAENHPEVVHVLLEHGADPNASGDILEYWSMLPSESATPKVTMPKGGMAALHYAARQGALEAVKALAETPRTDLNVTDPDGVNAPLYATLNGHYDVAAYLLERGANPNLADQYGRTVLFAAIDMNRAESEPRPPVKFNERVSPLQLARLALAKGANPNAPISNRVPSRCPLGCQSAGSEGATPLWRAARGNDLEAIELLLAAGADPLIRARDGSTPLMMAAGQGWRDDRSLGTEVESIAAMKMLVAAGLDINDKNGAGETALHGAAARGADAVVRFLVENGARLDTRDRANRTALDAAMGVPSQLPRPGDQYSQPPVRENTAKLLRELMAARGVAIEPYVRPAPAATPLK